MTSLRWGILGTGGIARAMTSDLRVNGFHVTAVGSRSRGSADAFAATHDIPRAHGSYEALVADPEVDVVYVSTPHTMHAENALLALDAGKHVLLEKPFTINAREAAAVVERAGEKGLVVLEAMWTRWLPHMERIREIVAQGEIGELRTVFADHNFVLPSDPQHRLHNPALGGGALLDLGIYPVSFAWDLLGEPSEILAHSTPTATGVDRQTSIVFGYPGGRQALLHTSLDTHGTNRAAIIGTRGRIEIHPVWYAPTSFTVYDTAGEVIERFDDEVRPRGMQFQAFELERLVASGAVAGEVLPPSESVAIMRSLDRVRELIGLRYPGEE